ncbi:MAG: endonuclease [Labilithrix sp.]|nr:endonuclease [Labilithrix sp.]MCW5817222.1 endonuclease [Labilithrix sp.]
MVGHYRSLFALVIAATTAAVGCVGNASESEEELTEESEADLDSVEPEKTSIENKTIPSYADVEDLEGTALREALFDKIKSHRSLGYNKARKTMFARDAAGFQTDNGKIECVYTGRLASPNGTTTVSSFNTEHSWPQSDGANREPAKSDLHHLFPSDSRANSSRSNFPFGEPACAKPGSMVRCSFDQGGSFMGKDQAGKNTFEVRPEKRGDIARAHFYMAVRYNLRIPNTEEVVLREWNDEDPVDAIEQKRNAAIESVQNNRNPFVDRPDFVAKIADF